MTESNVYYDPLACIDDDSPCSIRSSQSEPSEIDDSAVRV